MIAQLESVKFAETVRLRPLIDVRSPGEFAQGHVPGAINIPLFSDNERAVIGKLYVQRGRDQAILKGLDFALPKTGGYLEILQSKVPSGGTFRLHCWRGGLRSMLMGELFSHAGYHVEIVEGGYKAYRRAVRELFGLPFRVAILGGYTGSGKTAMLEQIAAAGGQVIDLERLACHKGSAFGSLGQPPQPTNEQFENDLHAEWTGLDPSGTIWMEDESRMIGRVTLPDPVFRLISESLLVVMEVPRETRIARLVNEYAGFGQALLAGGVGRITERLGGARSKEALAALASGEYARVAGIALAYYDKAYQHSMERRTGKQVVRFIAGTDDLVANAKNIMRMAEKHLDDGNIS